MIKDLKYLFAYLLPASAFLALAWHGPWAWSTVVLGFIIIPVLEMMLGLNQKNVPESEETQRSRLRFFDVLLYLNAPIVFAIVILYFHVIASITLNPAELIGLTFSVGIVVGACGINVAHELGHRKSLFEQRLSQLMLAPALYMHFFIEHNRGHHKHVATPLDPATARYGEMVYTFWWRSLSGGWLNAWRLESERLRASGNVYRLVHNQMFLFQVIQAFWLLCVALLFGLPGLLGALAVALIGILLLESVNYLEHYGLQRRQLPSGRYEPVMAAHSWNSDHEMGRIFLYELTRHSDHHFKSTRKYQILRHIDDSPQLPFGYPTSILISLAPPLWFALMHPRIRAWEQQRSGL